MKRKTTILLMPLVLAMTVDAAYATTATQAWVKTNVGNPLKANDDKLFANQVLLRDMLNVKDADGNWGTLDTQAQTAIQAINELKALQTDLQTAIEGKQDAGEYLVADDLSELQDAIAELESGKVDPETIAGIQTAIDGLGETYATKSDVSAADQALLDKINAINVPSLEGYVKASDLAAVATTGSYADLKDKPTIPSIEGLASSEQLTTLQNTLQAAIDEKQVKGEYLVAADLTTLNEAITALQSGKADASTVATLQESISKLGDTYASKADMTAADEALQAAIDNMDLSAYAKVADVESALALKENAANKVATATAEQIDAMSSEDKATKYPSISVAQTIANAAVTKVNEVAGDLSTLQTQVGTNTADIAEIKAAGYQTSDDVQGAITTATADLAAKADVYTKAQVDTAIGAIKEYDDTALAARVSTNETNIATNTSDIATNADAIAALRDAGFVAGAKTAGSYLVNFDASGKVSYASVEIVDDKGNPIDLTTGAIN